MVNIHLAFWSGKYPILLNDRKINELVVARCRGMWLSNIPTAYIYDRTDGGDLVNWQVQIGFVRVIEESYRVN